MPGTIGPMTAYADVDEALEAALGSAEAEGGYYSLPPSPTGGLGMGIRLHRNFSLKLSYTVSPGIKQENPNEDPRAVIDSYSSVGISYNL